MPRHPAILLSMLPTLLLLAGCGEEPAPEVRDVTRPVKTLLIEAPESGGVRNFPARIDAGHKAELAFRVQGKVQEVLVKEGERVAEGQELAKLDPKDFQIVVNDRQATFDNAKKNFNRAKGLIEKGHISKMDYDRLEAEFKNARAALESARQDLEYTNLNAPFAGTIAKRHIERFEEVQAKQTVLSLQHVQQLEVKFDVPESIIRGIRAAVLQHARITRAQLNRPPLARVGKVEQLFQPAEIDEILRFANRLVEEHRIEGHHALDDRGRELETLRDVLDDFRANPPVLSLAKPQNRQERRSTLGIAGQNGVDLLFAFQIKRKNHG